MVKEGHSKIKTILTFGVLGTNTLNNQKIYVDNCKFLSLSARYTYMYLKVTDIHDVNTVSKYIFHTIALPAGLY